MSSNLTPTAFDFCYTQKVLNPNFVIVGVIIQFLGGLMYLIDTIKGRIKPNKVTWLLWAIVPFIAFFAEVKQGVGILSLTTFIVGFNPLLIFLASFVNKKAQWRLGIFDLVCGFLSILGLFLWFTTKVGNLAILFSILADVLAGLPTIVKAYENPETENDLPFTMGTISAIIAILTIRKWDFQYYGFPVYLFFVNLLIAVVIRFRSAKLLRL